MKVLILSNNAIGLIKFRGELIEELHRSGIEVYVCVPPSEYKHELKKLRCRVKEIEFDRRSKKINQELELLVRFYRIVKRLKPDMVLTYTIKPNIYGGLICQIMRIPYISNITGLGTEINKKSFFSYLLLITYRFALKRAEKIFVQNDTIKYILKGNKRESDNYKVLPGSGVNLEKNKFYDFPADTEECRFLYIGRVMKDKGIEEYLEAAMHLKQKYSHVHFDIIGDFEEAQYEKKVKELTEKNIVACFPFQEDIRGVIAGHMAIIHPSYHEGMSNALLEAAATGRPVIASNIPGCRETFDDGITGYAFTVKDTEDMERKIDKFINLPYEKKKEMGIRARDKMVREFDRNIVINEYMKTIKTVMTNVQ